jgi:hypothetical protein
MVIKRIAASVVVGAGLTVSGVLFSGAWSGASSSGPTPASSRNVSLDQTVVRAADKAGLVMMCAKGRLDPVAEATYLAVVRAHPDLADGIGADCRIVPVAP